jgi:3'-phosphoadenosine 5'-phosphosulfate sulfotransferase (PAPS reductase)/FAD synthetase
MKTIVLVSGGKDSTAMLLIALERELRANVIPLFCDTGWEHPLTYEYLMYLESALKVKIHRTPQSRNRKGDPITGIEAAIRQRGRFPDGKIRFCTSALKKLPTLNWIKQNLFSELRLIDGAELWYGIRSNESAPRSKKYRRVLSEETYDLDDIYPQLFNKRIRASIRAKFPIIDWDSEECYYFLESKGIEPNPLYKEGTNDRVGCYPCLLASKSRQQAMFATEFGQSQRAKIRKLEEELGITYEPNEDETGGCSFCNV